MKICVVILRLSQLQAYYQDRTKYSSKTTSIRHAAVTGTDGFEGRQKSTDALDAASKLL
jgi:hypothetical protein